jgi:hypothetical protein
MTRKDYELIAAAIRLSMKAETSGINAESFRRGATDCAFMIAGKLKTENPNFDRARFLAACGVKE